MKKRSKIILISAVAVVLLAGVFFASNFLFNAKTSINENSDVTINYKSVEGNVSVKLSQEDSEKICEMFNNRELVFDPGISCPFSDDLSISIGKGVFYPSTDTCHTIKCGLKTFDLSEKRGKVLCGVLKKYGVDFSCID